MKYIISFIFSMHIVFFLEAIQFPITQYQYLSLQEFERLKSQDCLDVSKYEQQDHLRLKLMHQNLCWHLKIPTLQILSSYQNEKPENKIKIAILDTQIVDFAKSSARPTVNCFNLKCDSVRDKNLTFGERRSFFDQTSGIDLKNLFNRDIEDLLFRGFFEKYHGSFLSILIDQIAPSTEIVSIPILNEQGTACKKSLCIGLHKAIDLQVDIILLALKVCNIDQQDNDDQELLSLLSRCPYIVCAAGNDGQSCHKLSYPACLDTIFFSVGAFGKEDKQYRICDFSQSEKNVGPHFVMPGKDIACPIFVESLDNYVIVNVSGTSMAAALMAGCLALFLQNGGNLLSQQQLEYLVEKTSIFLHEDQWDGKVNFGTINMPTGLFVLKVLQKIMTKISGKKFERNFKQIVHQILRNLVMDNFFCKNKIVYARNRFSKKIDSKLSLLVEHSINEEKESLEKFN